MANIKDTGALHIFNPDALYESGLYILPLINP